MNIDEAKKMARQFGPVDEIVRQDRISATMQIAHISKVRTTVAKGSFSQSVKQDEPPTQRIIAVNHEWKELKFAGDIGLIVLENQAGLNLQRQPNADQLAAIAKNIVEFRDCSIIIRPGRFAVIEPSGVIAIRSQNEEFDVLCTIFPQ